MDTLTHALVGTGISDGWFRKRLGPVSTPFAFLVSCLPDADSVTYLMSAESAWANHRGYTHSVLPIVLASPVIGYIGYRVSKREGEWKHWVLLALLCLFSHTILDLATSWGTMPFLPFSRMRLSWDIAPILDIFVLSVSLGSFVLNRILRWERTETFKNPLAYPVVHRHPGRRRVACWVARVAVVLSVVYLLFGWHQNRQTVRVARQALAAEGVEVVEVRALPAMFTYIAWQIAARDAEGAVYNAVHSSYAPKPLRFTRYLSLSAAEKAAVLSTPEGGMFSWYSQGMYVAERKDDGVIRLVDRRFWNLLPPHGSRFMVDFIPDGGGGWAVRRTAHGPLNWETVRLEFERLWGLTWRGE